MKKNEKNVPFCKLWLIKFSKQSIKCSEHEFYSKMKFSIFFQKHEYFWSYISKTNKLRNVKQSPNVLLICILYSFCNDWSSVAGIIFVRVKVRKDQTFVALKIKRMCYLSYIIYVKAIYPLVLRRWFLIIRDLLVYSGS